MANQNSKNKKKTNTNKPKTTNKSSEAKKETKTYAKNENKKEAVKKEVKKEVNKAEDTKKEIKTEAKVKDTKKKTSSISPKQRDLILVLLAVVLIIVAFLITGTKKEETVPVALEGDAGFNEISYATYQEKVDSEKPFLVVIVKDGCGYCEMYEPILEEVATEYSLPINYINLTNLTEEEYNDLASTNNYLKKEEWGTPTTLYMQGEKIVDSIGGYVAKDKVVDFIEKNFVVEK